MIRTIATTAATALFLAALAGVADTRTMHDPSACADCHVTTDRGIPCIPNLQVPDICYCDHLARRMLAAGSHTQP
jgi:hypothetical protein